MPGPGAQINSLMDMMQQPQAPPQQPRQYGSWDQDLAYYMQPQVPLYSGGGVGMATPGGGGGGQGGVFSPPADMARYFDQYGGYKIDDPRTVAADAGISMSQLASSLLPRYGREAGEYAGQGYSYPSDKGGFFTIQDVFNQSGTPTQVPGMGPQRPGGPSANTVTQRLGGVALPSIATFNAQMPSTNNWRLLGMGPGWIMRNGQLIDTRSSGVRWGGPAGYTPSGGNSGEQSMPAIGTGLGTGVGYGVPNKLQAGLGQPVTYGWPGAAQWWHDPGATPDAGLGG
jgi:hypothetical protein